MRESSDSSREFSGRPRNAWLDGPRFVPNNLRATRRPGTVATRYLVESGLYSGWRDHRHSWPQQRDTPAGNADTSTADRTTGCGYFGSSFASRPLLAPGASRRLRGSSHTCDTLSRLPKPPPKRHQPDFCRSARFWGRSISYWRSMSCVVGATGLEPVTSCV